MRMMPSRSASAAMTVERLRTPLVEVKNVAPPVVRTDVQWQRDAYAYASSIGEVGYGLNNKANTVAQCRLALERREGRTWVPADDDDQVARVADEFEGPIGGQAELLRAASLHLDIAGECYLVGTPIPEFGPTAMFWEYLSTLEIRVDGPGRVQRLRYGTAAPEWVPFDGYVARMHRRDAMNSERPDSPMRRVLPICAELVTLTQVVDAIARTRLNAGIWFVPHEVSFGPDEETEDASQEAEYWDKFDEEMAEHFNDAIVDRASPSSLLPLQMRGPALIDDHPTKDLMGMVDLTRPLDDHYRELREEARARLADGLDWPREIVTGKGNMTHWNANNIDADYLQRHVQPTGNFAADFSTAAYLRPRIAYLLDRGEIGDVNPLDYRWRFDISPVSGQVDSSNGATEAFAADVYAEDAWLRDLGLDPIDKASPEERLNRMLSRMTERDPRLARLTFPLLFPDDPRVREVLASWPDEIIGGEPDRPQRPGRRPTTPGKSLSEELVELLEAESVASSS